MFMNLYMAIRNQLLDKRGGCEGASRHLKIKSSVHSPPEGARAQREAAPAARICRRNFRTSAGAFVMSHDEFVGTYITEISELVFFHRAVEDPVRVSFRAFF